MGKWSKMGSNGNCPSLLSKINCFIKYYGREN